MSEPAAEPHYVDYDDFIRHHLDRARSGIRWADILTAAVGLAVFLVGYLLAFAVLDHWVVAGGFGPTARVAMLAAVLAAATGWVAAKVVRPVLRRVNPLYAAHEIERAHPEFAGTLFGLVDAEREDGGRGVRPAIAAALRKRAATGLAEVDPDETVDRGMLMRLSYALLALAVLGSLYALFSPKSLGNAAARAFVPTSATETATRTRIVEVVPGDATLAAGEVLEIVCEYADADPERAVVLFTTDDRRAVGEEVELLPVPDRVKRLAATWAGVSGSGVVGSAEYVVRVGDDEAGPFRLKVLTPPAPEVAAVTLAPPAYTGLPASESSDPVVAGVEGTEVTLSVDCDRPLRTAKVVFADEAEFAEPAEEVTLSAVGGEGEDAQTFRYEARWTLEIRPDGSSPAFYRIEAVDEAGVATVRPPVYPVEVRPDLPPVVKIGRPKSPVTAKSRAVVPIEWAAADPDFALRDVILRLEKNGSDVPRVVPLYEGVDKSASGRHRFDLRPLRLRTGDVVTVRPQARDNREPRPNRRIGDPLEIRIDDEPQPEPERPENPPPDRRDEPTERNQDGEQGEGQSGEGQAGEPGETGGKPGGESFDGAAGEEGGSGEGTPGGPQDGRPGKEGSAGGEQSESPEGTGSPDGAGGDQSAREEPVANDGTQDDDALRELLERDREKRSEQRAEGERGGEGSEPPEGSGGDDLSGGDQGNAPDERQPDAGENGESGNQAAGGSGESETDGADGGASSDGDGGPTETGATDRPSAGEDRPPGGSTDGGDERPGDPADDRTPNESTEGSETGPARGGTSDETDLPQAPDDLEREGPEGEKRRRPEEGSPPEDGAAADPEAAETGASADDREGDGATPEGGDETTGRPEDTAEASRPDRSGEDGGPSPGQSKTGEPGPPDPSSDSAAGDGEDAPGQSGEPGDAGENGGGKSPGEGRQGEGSDPPPPGSAGEQPGGESPSGRKGEGDEAPAGEKPPSGREGNPSENEGAGEGSGESGSGSGEASGQEGSGEGSSGQGEAAPGSASGSTPGESGGQSGGSAGEGGGVTSEGAPSGGGDGGTALNDGEAGGEGTAPPPRGVDTSDPDDLRRATDLVLDRLDEDIRRGEVDPELLDRLGWTEDDLKKFAGRMRDRREQATRPGNEAGARAFDELLESVRPSGEIGGTRGTNRTAPDAGGTVGRRPPPPASLAERFEAFSRSVAGERPAD